MTMVAITCELIKCKRLAFGGGVTTAIGGLCLEYYHLKRTLDRLINTDCLDFDKKRPDYIYIKYSVYRESKALLRKQEFDDHWVNIFVQPFGKWWKSFKHSVAWRLLEVAKTGDHYDRLKAVHQLARIDHLKDWDYQHLAQLCDARTAISLARHECDARWFVAPKGRGSVRAMKSLIAELREHLDRVTDDCPCVKHFRKNALANFAILKSFEADTDDRAQKPFSRSSISTQEFQFVTQCLHVVFHVTRDRTLARRMIEHGILQTLVEVNKLFYYNTEVLFLLAKIMVNLSLCAGKQQDFFVTGWVGLLASMSRFPDLRVQVTAAKALTNLDTDDYNRFEYNSRVYPLYPKFCSRQRPEVDVVFVHGLLGGVFVTWRQKDRDEPQLGLYGKNAFYYTKDKDDDIQHMIEEYNRNAPKFERNRRRCPSHRPAPIRTAPPPATIADGENGTLQYNEPQFISRGPVRSTKPELSDLATKELIATLRKADEIAPDWEVVYADCPIDSSVQASGPFSIAGNEWQNDESPDEYTYCWPMDWLPADYPTVRVLGLNYETALSEWYTNYHASCPCEKSGTLHNRSAELLRALVTSGAGQEGRPVVWVGHSMGGLIAKSIIVQASESGDPRVRQLADNSRAIVFLGTPHKGSAVAKLKQHTQMILSPTVEVKELEENSEYLLDLHQKFERFMATMGHDMRIVSVVEGCPTMLTTFKFPFHIVQEQSARLTVGDHYVLNVDHLALSKPVLRQSFLYQRLAAVVGSVINSAQEEEQRQLDDDTADKADVSSADTAQFV